MELDCERPGERMVEKEMAIKAHGEKLTAILFKVSRSVLGKGRRSDC